MSTTHPTATRYDDDLYHREANRPHTVVIYTVYRSHADEYGSTRILWASRHLDCRRDHWDQSRYAREVAYDDRYDPAQWQEAALHMLPQTSNVCVLVNPGDHLPDTVYLERITAP